MLCALQYQTRQPPRGIGAGVNADTIGQDLRTFPHRMAMHDDDTVICGRQKEVRVPPKEIVFGLIVEGSERVDAGMDEQIIALAVP